MRPSHKPAIIAALEGIDRWLVSGMILASSVWASWVLSHPPSNFAAFPQSFRWASENVLESELAWAGIIGAGALLHMGSIFLHVIQRMLTWPPWGEWRRWLAFAALAIESSVFLLFGLTTMINNPDTFFGFCGTMIGAAAAFRMLKLGWINPDGR